MNSAFPILFKIFAAAGLLVLTFFGIFVLNALRIAVVAYLRRPIRNYWKTLASKEGYVPYLKIPASAECILISAEDIVFPKHHGFYFPAVLYAMRENYCRKLKKADKWGGSGITQQLVKNLYLYPKKTYTRKLAELFLAIWIELRISKQQIVELYFNIVYFGRSQYGITAAAQYYMGKPPCDLSINQLISLICILPNPDCYNPLDHPEMFQKARSVTLRQLQSFQCITPEYAELLASMPWNADSGTNELVIMHSLLTKSPCYRENLKSEDPKYVDFHQNGPQGLMLHSVGCSYSAPFGFLRQWNRRSFDDACVHAFIDANDGAVYQTLPWNFRGWHCGGAGNNTHIGIEMCESEAIRYLGGADFEVLDSEAARQHARRTYASAVRLFAMLCRTYRLESGAIISHREGCSLGLASDHKDPEHLWEGLGLDLTMDRFRADVAAQTQAAPLWLFSGPPQKKKYPLWVRLRNFVLRK